MIVIGKDGKKYFIVPLDQVINFLIIIGLVLLAFLWPMNK